MAMLTIVPPATVFWRYLSAKPLAVPGRIVEFGALLLGVVVTQFVVSYITQTNLFGLAAALYAPTPFLLWATVRFGAAGLSFTLLWATLLTIFTALAGHGPLGGTTADTVIGVQLLLTANAIPMVLMAGVLEQSRAEHAALEVSQQRYALATAAGGIGVWDFDVLSREVRVEGTLKATLGYEEEEIGGPLGAWEALIFPGDRADVLSRLEAVANGSATTFDAEFRLIHKDGSLRWLLSKGATTDTVDGKPARIRGTYTDITQQKEAARSLNEANEAVVRMGRIASMAEVGASIAHELNQPLAAISANATTGVRWIESGVNVGQLHEVLSDISRDSRRASTIVERTHRMFTNHPAQEAPMNLNDIVRTMLAVVDHRLRKLDVQVTVTLDEGLPPVVADPVQIQQVLLNLIVNAADAMHESGDRRSLGISTRRSKKHVVVSVRDTGKGLDSQTADRMFEPFYTTKSGGTGMGLAISRSIVDSHGGSLWAVANVDRGTTFRFKIPLPGNRASA
jgi:PAS domain S-box-containing protein